MLKTKSGARAVTAISPKRVASPLEISGLTFFTAFGLATFVTGEVIHLKGGSVLCG